MFGYERGLKASDLAEIKNTKIWVKDEWSLKKGGRLQQTSNTVISLKKKTLKEKDKSLLLNEWSL